MKRCYGLPGDTLNYVTDAIRRSGMRWVHVRHEEVGGVCRGRGRSSDRRTCRVRGIMWSRQPSLHQRSIRKSP
ncbi:MAG: hypothetical protein WDN50_08070 [Bradyrhizobium sp.]